MFGYPREKSVDSVRCKMLQKMVGENTKLTSKSKVDFSKLPPCLDNLLPHCYRVNHRLSIYKRADQPMFAKAKPYNDNQGWLKVGDSMEPMWSCGPILSSSPVDLVEETVEEIDCEEENKIDLDDLATLITILH